MNFKVVSVIQILLLMIMLVNMRSTSAKAYRRVLIHVPMKVKHHHHTHTVFKHVHHSVPVHYDHHDVHVIHPETIEEQDIHQDYHLHGRGIDSVMEDFSSAHPGLDYDTGIDNDYENFEKFLRKRSKSKQKYFNNKVIGWKGRSDYDKIAAEYLASIKRQPLPDSDDQDDRYAPYDDDSKKK